MTSRAKPKESRDLLPFTIIVGVGFILSLLPLLINGIFSARDLLSFYLEAAPQFAKQFYSGDLYPRWLIDANGGLGSPTFFFQGPLPFYINSFFALIFKDSLGWLPLVLSSGLAYILSGVTAFLWLKESTNRSIAIFASLIYMLLPYHLAVDIYYRFNLAEIWSFVWIPLLLYLVLGILKQNAFSLIRYSLCYAALVLTEPSIALIFGLVAFGYAFILSLNKWKAILLQLLGATILGLGLSAIYWYPALLMQNNIALKNDKALNYANNFLFKIPPNILDTQLWKYLEVITILTLVVAGCAWAIARFNPQKKYSIESYYWFSLAIISVVMSTPLGQLIWIIFPPLHSIFLPWTFNILLVVATTALTALAIFLTGNPLSVFIDKPIKIIVFLSTIFLLVLLEVLPLSGHLINNTVLAIMLVLLLLTAIVYIKEIIDFSHYKVLVVEMLLIFSLILSNFPAIAQVISNKPNNNIKQQLSLAPNYRPRWTSPKSLTRAYLNRQNKAEVIAGSGSVITKVWKPGNIVLQVDAQKDSLIKVNQLYYPNWVASIVNQNKITKEPTHPTKNEGLLELKVPSGSSQVRLKLETSQAEKTGQIISILSLLALLGWLLYYYYWLAPANSKSK